MLIHKKTLPAFFSGLIYALSFGCSGTPAPESEDPAGLENEEIEAPAPPVLKSTDKPSYESVAVDAMEMFPDGAIEDVQAFRIGKYEVQVDEFRRCVNAGFCLKEDFKSNEKNARCNFSYESGEKGDHPMNCVTWFGARDFCLWMMGDLPMDEQWELAASGPDRTAYPWGDSSAGVGCDRMTSSPCVEKNTRQVGSAKDGAAECGAMDMSGNVAEWVNNSREAVKGDSHALLRIIRGGSYRHGQGQSELKATHPGLVLNAGEMKPSVGFRCAFGGDLIPPPAIDDVQKRKMLREIYGSSLKSLAEAYWTLKKRAGSDEEYLSSLKKITGDQMLLLASGIARRSDIEGCRQHSAWASLVPLIREENLPEKLCTCVWQIVGNSLRKCITDYDLPSEARARWLREWAGLCRATGSPDILLCSPAKMEREAASITRKENSRNIARLKKKGICSKGIKYCVDNYFETELKQHNPFGGQSSTGVSQLKIEGTQFQALGWPEDSAQISGGDPSMTLKWKLIQDCALSMCSEE